MVTANASVVWPQERWPLADEGKPKRLRNCWRDQLRLGDGRQKHHVDAIVESISYRPRDVQCGPRLSHPACPGKRQQATNGRLRDDDALDLVDQLLAPDECRQGCRQVGVRREVVFDHGCQTFSSGSVKW